MLTERQLDFILSEALVPEQIPDMMSYLSGGEAKIFDESCLFFVSKDWAVFVGYPQVA